MSKLLESEHYNPERLLDALADRKRLRNDAALARVLGIGAPALSKVRNRHVAIGGDLLVRMVDAFDMDLDLLRQLGGIPHTGRTKPEPFGVRVEATAETETT